MAPTLHTFLPSTRSGRTFFVALSLLGLGALVQLMVLAGYLARGGIAPRPAAEIHFAETMSEPAAVAESLAAPVRLQPAVPTPAPVVVAPPAAAGDSEAPAMTRPTPAPAARYQAKAGDFLEQARQLRTRGDTNSALARLREAQVAEPDNPQVIAEMALTYEAMQIPDRAFEQWQRLYNLGEGVGALYYLADTKLHNVPTAPVTARQGEAGTGTQSAVAAVNDAAILKLTDIHKQDLTDPSVEQKISLKIVVKNRPGTVIDPMKVIIHTYFYDLVDGKDTVLTDAQTDFAWLSQSPVNWANDKSELLETTYVRPKAAPVPTTPAVAETSPRGGKGHPRRGEPAVPPPAAAPTPVRTYLGYTVRLYYDRQLQDAQADPVRLLQQFPPPVTLPSE